MILLDTNVVSEAMRPRPNPGVMQWLNDQVADSVFLSSVTLAELRFGIGVLPGGRRKNQLKTVLSGLLDLFDERVLAFDVEAADRYADIAVRARVAGRGLSTPDGYIAAIADSRGMSVATRDTSPFEAAGVPVINPWKT
ncbi:MULTISPECIES: type II toxin-antitoxin system VapC family toxin [unclassified Wenzhouxiangella]|uniref:type II toxin-antitoxin system VapC family toxin n=1 Tax=unclassified Wenzhouxiangella TaxID=2613841 RepID=UPI000E327875|nr:MULTISPECIES: type II toxin-antitoxin system VapC family toxin [unclassified Wenzhouxiangella]RFF27312.1 type II toxin-antitoxin system VapC family toxin [Wenzhouxiangella sp. 15181]RFP68745.1 type II toxin-antitoxin system VapC family toxin [Wenzhouxiangella sp. 15190]